MTRGRGGGRVALRSRARAPSAGAVQRRMGRACGGTPVKPALWTRSQLCACVCAFAPASVRGCVSVRAHLPDHLLAPRDVPLLAQLPHTDAQLGHAPRAEARAAAFELWGEESGVGWAGVSAAPRGRAAAASGIVLGKGRHQCAVPPPPCPPLPPRPPPPRGTHARARLVHDRVQLGEVCRRRGEQLLYAEQLGHRVVKVQQRDLGHKVRVGLVLGSAGRVSGVTSGGPWTNGGALRRGRMRACAARRRGDWRARRNRRKFARAGSARALAGQGRAYHNFQAVTSHKAGRRLAPTRLQCQQLSELLVQQAFRLHVRQGDLLLRQDSAQVRHGRCCAGTGEIGLDRARSLGPGGGAQWWEVLFENC